MILVPEERSGFFLGPEVCVGVVEIFGISVAPGDCEEIAPTEKYQGKLMLHTSHTQSLLWQIAPGSPQYVGQDHRLLVGSGGRHTR